MRPACGCDEAWETAVGEAADEERERPWWTDRGIMVPVFSGVAFLAGLVLEWSGMAIPALVAFWIGLLEHRRSPRARSGKLFKGKLGISLLMTISAIGAVILGYVEEAAALGVPVLDRRGAGGQGDGPPAAGYGRCRSWSRRLRPSATAASVEVAAKDLQVGQLMLVRPGERIATDGIVRTGRSSLDTRKVIVGRVDPVEVEPGDTVSAGADQHRGCAEVETTVVGTDNFLTTIVELVEQAQVEKGDRARLPTASPGPWCPAC